MKPASHARVINMLANLPEIFPHTSVDTYGHAACSNYSYLLDLAHADEDRLDDEDFAFNLKAAYEKFKPYMMFFDDQIRDFNRYSFFHNGANDDDISATAAMLFEESAPAVWEIHIMARKSARGGDAVEFGIASMNAIFEQKKADYIWGKISVANKAALGFARKVGGETYDFRNVAPFGQVERFRVSRVQWDAFMAKYLMKTDAGESCPL